MKACHTVLWTLGLVFLAAPVAAESEPAARADPAAAGEQRPPAEDEAAGRVARAAVTTGVVGREPRDSVERVSGDVMQLSYFTELVELQGRTITHVWERQGEEMARVSFEVGGPRWRVHSTKQLRPDWIGAWRVSVVDESGNELRSDHFYFASSEAEEPATAETVPAESEPAPPASAP